MTMQLAMYRGPADDLLHKLGHWGVCAFTWSPYSHVELVIEGRCYSSSSRDGGVRSKVIDLASGKWDLYDVAGNEAAALVWFAKHTGMPYDWAGVLRFGIPFLPRREDEWFCSEAVAAMLGYACPDKFTPQSLLDRVLASRRSVYSNTKDAPNA